MVMRPDNVLFASSNGIGLGHLARQMAVADRLAAGQRSVFLTMSYAAATLKQAGYLCLMTSHHRSNGLEVEAWNAALEQEYLMTIDELRPKAFVYDATAVFSGVVEMLYRVPKLTSIWIRRPMWRPVHAQFLQHSARFTLVVEPGELADELDDGPTKAVQSETMRVSPILHTDPGDRLTREAARQALGLPLDAVVICLQISNGGAYDLGGVRASVVERLLALDNVFVVELRSALVPAADSADNPRHLMLNLFPAFRYSAAWDAAVSAAGYNSFHENVLGAVPTLFVPNEGDEMDMQATRARWAKQQGCGLMIRREEAGELDAALERLLDAGERDAMRNRCRSIEWSNGAIALARHIDALPSVT